MKYLSLCMLFLAMTCGTPKKENPNAIEEIQPEELTRTTDPVKEEMKDNQLVVILNNPKQIESAKALITNSGLTWNELDLEAKGVVSALVTIPSNKKDFWKQRLQESNVFESVDDGKEEVINELKSKLQNRLISIKKTACFGDCPVYDFYINKDGKAFFNGREHVLKSGKHEFELSEKELKSLLDKIENSDFSKFKDAYDDPRITDLASTYIFCDGRQVKVRLWQNIPDDLSDIHEYATEFLYDKKFLE
ncbi:conserved protein of unknown function [Tenacibaculum sp. 190130A14a]|uniref:DUF6438 domain-containing protein n=1 Tax=Tenacibaculum polynesiense TaxID=3137857 RepID=A0ABM9P891_9FLAO